MLERKQFRIWRTVASQGGMIFRLQASVIHATLVLGSVIRQAQAEVLGKSKKIVPEAPDKDFLSSEVGTSSLE